MKKVILMIVTFLTTSIFAGTQTGKIKKILVRDDGLHWIVLEGTKTGSPVCATIGYWMIKDENSTYGKSQFSMLLAAQMSDRAVKITGKNTCSRWGDGEDIGTITLVN